MVKIPYRMMLDVLLETVQLPAAEYRSKVCDGNRVCVTAFSVRPHQYVEDHGSRMAIPGVWCVNHAMSEDTAAMEAIGYIKCMAKTEIRDYNYSTMKKLNEENESLKHELAVAKYNRKKMTAKTRSIKNRLMLAKYKNKKHAMGWFFLARYMHGFSDHISNVTALNKSSGKEPIDQLINGPLNSIEKVAKRLKCRVISSEKKLRSIRRGF